MRILGQSEIKNFALAYLRIFFIVRESWAAFTVSFVSKQRASKEELLRNIVFRNKIIATPCSV